MKTAICTISTASHLYKSLALFESVRRTSDTDFLCLVTDSNQIKPYADCQFHTLANLSLPELNKFNQRFNSDQFRWFLKPVYTKWLLENGYDQVIYVDNDIYFFSSPNFLFEKLNHFNFLLTPHFYKADPTSEQNWLEANFRVGLFNAGFFGVNKKGIKILEWWIQCCTYTIKKSYWRGLYDDQKYLDLVPIRFEGVEIVKHKGCNLAGWNDQNYQIISSTAGELSVNNDPIIFIHFAALTMERFGEVAHPLHQLYKQYVEHLCQFNPKFTWKRDRKSKLYFSNIWYYLKWKIVRFFEK